jgi:hypothetical protein
MTVPRFILDLLALKSGDRVNWICDGRHAAMSPWKESTAGRQRNSPGHQGESKAQEVAAKRPTR